MDLGTGLNCLQATRDGGAMKVVILSRVLPKNGQKNTVAMIATQVAALRTTKCQLDALSKYGEKRRSLPQDSAASRLKMTLGEAQ